MYKAKKLAVVSTISSLVTVASMKDTLRLLEKVLCIYHPLYFQKNLRETRMLINSGSKVNAMTLVYAAKLGLKVRKINIKPQKIDGSILDTFGIVLADFQVEDKLDKTRYFQETLLVVNTTLEVIFGIPFLTLSNADVQFVEKELTWRSYSTAKALPIIKRVELNNKKEFAKATLDKNSKTLVIYMASVNPKIYPDRKAQIVSLFTKEIKILEEYSDFTDVFSEKKALVLPECIKLNEHAINLENGKQPPYKLIYSLGPMELETLKTYIETNLKTGFIQPSKFPADTPILFDKKSDGSVRLCVNYRGLNNLTIKNRYSLPLIGKSLDWLSWAKRFTQLDLTSAYHQIRIKEEDKWKTAFQTRYGHFKYQVMPFRLSNVPASFQGYINKILAEKLDIFVIMYLNDILIYINNPGQEHMEAV